MNDHVSKLSLFDVQLDVDIQIDISLIQQKSMSFSTNYSKFRVDFESKIEIDGFWAN